MTEACSKTSLPRRSFLAGAAGATLLTLAACRSYAPWTLEEAVRHLLLRSSDRAFARLIGSGAYWDDAVARLGLGQFLGVRGDAISSVLTSALFKSRMEDAFADYAEDAAYRAAPVVSDAVRVVGISNATAIMRGGPTAATAFLREEVGFALVEAMVPEISEAMRMADDPLVNQALAALTGVDASQVAHSFADEVSAIIWDEIGREEAAIRADPAATNDPVLIGAFGTASSL